MKSLSLKSSELWPTNTRGRTSNPPRHALVKLSPALLNNLEGTHAESDPDGQDKLTITVRDGHPYLTGSYYSVGSTYPFTLSEPVELLPEMQQQYFTLFTETQVSASRKTRRASWTAVSSSPVRRSVNPFFSPDGKWIGFMADRQLKKVSVQGGASITICEGANIRGADWGEDGNIVYGITNAPLQTVPESGGNPRSLDKPQNGDISQRWPQILPGGEAILFTGHNSAGGFDDAHI